MPPVAFLYPQNAPKSLAALPRPPSRIKGATSKGRGKGGRGREANRRKGGAGGEGRDFGPSQCWKQIDAPESNKHTAFDLDLLTGTFIIFQSRLELQLVSFLWQSNRSMDKID